MYTVPGSSWPATVETTSPRFPAAGAVGVAALRAGVVTPDAEGRETVVLLTGRNVAPKLLSEVLHS